MSLKHLKSGTDIRGTAVGDNPDLSDDAVKKITAGFVRLMSEKTGLDPQNMTVALGHDSRVSARRIKKAVISVLSAYGVKTLDCGLSSTPAMFMTTVELGCTAAVQITASHHPWDKNGLKFFTDSGGFEGEDVARVLEYADKETLPTFKSDDNSEKIDFMSRYSELLRDIICKGVNSEDYEKPLKGFRIITDAGNGAGGFFAEKVLKPLGADIEGSLFLEPDGMFPNHIPNPENETAMGFISRAVVENHGDLGVIFDTDVDRAACVDSDGNEINRNRLIALASVIALEGNEGGTVVTDSVTGDGLKEFIEDTLGGKHHRFKRGYKNVINEAIRLNKEGVNCPLAIETSGHAAMRENYFLDDGAYLVTKIIILFARLRKEGRTIGQLIGTMREAKESAEVRINILSKDFKSYGEEVISRLTELGEKTEGMRVADDNYEGVRIALDKAHGDGWMLLRMSVHDPLLVFNAESDSQGGVQMILDVLYDFLKGFNKLKY